MSAPRSGIALGCSSFVVAKADSCCHASELPLPSDPFPGSTDIHRLGTCRLHRARRFPPESEIVWSCSSTRFFLPRSRRARCVSHPRISRGMHQRDRAGVSAFAPQRHPSCVDVFNIAFDFSCLVNCVQAVEPDAVYLLDADSGHPVSQRGNESPTLVCERAFCTML